MQAQDSSDPTGVAVVSGRHQPETRRARERKANAALKMALDGKTWDKIARVLGYPTPRAALVAVEQALERQIGSMDRDHLRLFYSKKIERLARAIDAKAMDAESPEQLAAVGRVRELYADQRRLLGLDAPAEVIVTNPTSAEIDQWVARLAANQVPNADEADITGDEGEDFDIVDAEIVEDGDTDAVQA